MSTGTIPQGQLRELFDNLVDHEGIAFENMSKRAWEIFKNYGELLRFDVFNIMMVASQQFGAIKLEEVILKLEAHYETVRASLDGGRFHDEVSVYDIVRSMKSNSTQEMLQRMYTDLGIRKMRPEIVTTTPRSDGKN